MELKGSRTEQNLHAALSSESQLRVKYEYYAQKAEADGYRHIAQIFEQTANNEKAHAGLWLKLLQEQTPDTAQNLDAAVSAENHEWADKYAHFAQVAKEEGFARIATLFEEVGKIEQAHEGVFRALLKNVESGRVFDRDGDMLWQCGNCGHIEFGKKAPQVCPVCAYPQSYFQPAPQQEA